MNECVNYISFIIFIKCPKLYKVQVGLYSNGLLNKVYMDVKNAAQEVLEFFNIVSDFNL